jgi:hypothetical protein
MPNQNLWIRPATEEEQGSFCDRMSEVGYINLSETDAEEEQESAMRRGDGIIEVVRYDSTSDRPSRFNVNLTETDSQGYDFPTKQGPGK